MQMDRLFWIVDLGAVVGHDKRVFVEHGALEARIGAHVFTNLFAHEPSVAIGCKGIKEHPENFPRTHVPEEKFHTKVLDGREITHEGEAGPHGNGQPKNMLINFLEKLLERQFLTVEADTGTSVAFDLALNPQENFAVDRLWAGITTP